MLPLISFETGRSTQIQSSGLPEKAAPANGSLVLSEYRNHGREVNTRGEESGRIYTRAPPKRVGRAFALLTKTYHGSRITGNLGIGTERVCGLFAFYAQAIKLLSCGIWICFQSD